MGSPRVLEFQPGAFFRLKTAIILSVFWYEPGMMVHVETAYSIFAVLGRWQLPTAAAGAREARAGHGYRSRPYLLTVYLCLECFRVARQCELPVTSRVCSLTGMLDDAVQWWPTPATAASKPTRGSSPTRMSQNHPLPLAGWDGAAISAHPDDQLRVVDCIWW